MSSSDFMTPRSLAIINVSGYIGDTCRFFIFGLKSGIRKDKIKHAGPIYRNEAVLMAVGLKTLDEDGGHMLLRNAGNQPTRHC